MNRRVKFADSVISAIDSSYMICDLVTIIIIIIILHVFNAVFKVGVDEHPEIPDDTNWVDQRSVEQIGQTGS